MDGQEDFKQAPTTEKKSSKFWYIIILAVLAAVIIWLVIPSLYALGVFSPGTSGIKCSPCFDYFAYLDYYGGTLVIRNGPQDIEDISVSSIPAGASTDKTSAGPGETIT